MRGHSAPLVDTVRCRALDYQALGAARDGHYLRAFMRPVLMESCGRVTIGSSSRRGLDGWRKLVLPPRSGGFVQLASGHRARSFSRLAVGARAVATNMRSRLTAMSFGGPVAQDGSTLVPSP